MKRGLPNIVPGRVDVTVFTVLCYDVSEAIVKILRRVEVPWFDDDLSGLVDIAPLASNLNRCESLGKMKSEIKARLNDDLPGAVYIAILVIELPTRQSVVEVSPDSGAVLIAR